VIKRYRDEKQTDMFFIDYLQRISMEKTNGKGKEANWLKIKEISKILADTALDVKVPLIVGAQVNRESKDKNDKVPTADNMREGGDIEQDAHNMLISHIVRYAKDNPDAIKYANDPKYILRVAKNRNGPEHDYAGFFKGHCLRFKINDIAKPEDYS
jgi:replicative DNA helicase